MVPVRLRAVRVLILVRPLVLLLVVPPVVVVLPLVRDLARGILRPLTLF